jgi:hypothetical protein
MQYVCHKNESVCHTSLYHEHVIEQSEKMSLFTYRRRCLHSHQNLCESPPNFFQRKSEMTLHVEERFLRSIAKHTRKNLSTRYSKRMARFQKLTRNLFLTLHG